MPEVTNMKGPTERQSAGQGDKKSIPRSRDDDSKDNDVDDEMTPLSDYVLPARQTMSGNFRSSHEEHLVSRLMTKWNMIKDENQQTREQARRAVRKIAVEELAKDWMTSDIGAEVRAFLIDNILPTLVLGVEKLLVEVEKRNLVEESEPDNNFNPLNFLAQYLMRNNPKYSNYAEASPYMRGLRSVSEELKLQLLSRADNKLMVVKMATRSKRQEREAAESVTAVETQRRIDALQQQFMEWGNGKKIELALVQNALLSFVEMVSQMLPEVRANMRLNKELDPTDDTGKGVHQTDFVEHLMPFVTSISSTAFDMLLSHLSSCAKVYRYSLESSERKTILLQLFKSCDYSRVGLLSRHRILELLAAFYNRLPSEIKSSLRDPGQWPVREISELEDDESCGLEVSEDMQVPKADDESNERRQRTSTEFSVQDLPMLSTEDEIHIRQLSFEVVQTAINDAKVLIAAAEGSLSPAAIQETSASETTPLDGSATEEENGSLSLVKAVSAGSRMIDRGIAFVDRARLDNWTGTLAYSSLSQSQLCVFNEYTLNGAQFVQLIDTFLNMSVDSALFNQLLSYIKEGYVLAEDETTLKIMKERLTAEELQRKTKLNRLFDIWDNEGSGFLNCDEAAWIIGTYKDLREREVADRALATFREKFNFSDDRFTKHEFRDFLMSVVELLPRGDTFDMFIDFLIGSLALSYAEQARGDARKKWLQQMIVAAETSGSNMEPVYKSLFDAITKDAELHGDDKSVSISIALLERNLWEPERGAYILHYTAATPDHAKHVLGKVFYKDMKGISFAAVASGRPIHVPKISKHGNIHFWDPEKNIQNTEGSFIVIPLKDKKKRVFGLLCIDTINDSRNQKHQEPVVEHVEQVDTEEDQDEDEAAEKQLRKSSISCIFSGHEIQFYQGVAKAFSIAYHLVNVRQKMMQTSEHALSWIAHRCPHIQESTLYLVESTRETMDIVLRKMMVTKSSGSVSVFHFDPPQLERKDNFFREYLFKCADSSELVAMTAYGELHLVVPLRNNDGQTVIVYDINLGSLTSLPKSEMFEMTRTLQLLQAAYKEITLESQDGVRTTALKGDQLDNDTRTEVLFGRLMLLKLRQSIYRLDASAYAELRNDDDVAEVSHPVVKAMFCLLQPDLAQKGILEDWQKCRVHIGPSTSAKIVLYDPTEHSTTDTPVALIESWLKDTTYEKIAKHRLLLVRHLYNWVWSSVLLIKSVSKVKGHQLNEGASK